MEPQWRKCFAYLASPIHPWLIACQNFSSFCAEANIFIVCVLHHANWNKLWTRAKRSQSPEKTRYRRTCLNWRRSADSCDGIERRFITTTFKRKRAHSYVQRSGSVNCCSCFASSFHLNGRTLGFLSPDLACWCLIIISTTRNYCSRAFIWMNAFTLAFYPQDQKFKTHHNRSGRTSHVTEMYIILIHYY